MENYRSSKMKIIITWKVF